MVVSCMKYPYALSCTHSGLKNIVLLDIDRKIRIFFLYFSASSIAFLYKKDHQVELDGE